MSAPTRCRAWRRRMCPPRIRRSRTPGVPRQRTPPRDRATRRCVRTGYQTHSTPHPQPELRQCAAGPVMPHAQRGEMEHFAWSLALIARLLVEGCDGRNGRIPPSLRPVKPVRNSGMVRQYQTSDAQLRIGESRDSRFDASHRPGMTSRHRNPPNPHHIWHKYQAGTAIAWPRPGDVLIGSLPLDRHPRDRPRP
jgi:hypothetical protein